MKRLDYESMFNLFKKSSRKEIVRDGEKYILITDRKLLQIKDVKSIYFWKQYGHSKKEYVELIIKKFLTISTIE